MSPVIKKSVEKYYGPLCISILLLPPPFLLTAEVVVKIETHISREMVTNIYKTTSGQTATASLIS